MIVFLFSLSLSAQVSKVTFDNVSFFENDKHKTTVEIDVEVILDANKNKFIVNSEENSFYFNLLESRQTKEGDTVFKAYFREDGKVVYAYLVIQRRSISIACRETVLIMFNSEDEPQTKI